jgi:hypothetical protein
MAELPVGLKICKKNLFHEVGNQSWIENMKPSFLMAPKVGESALLIFFYLSLKLIKWSGNIKIS